jgi:hypothetical protein
VARMGRFMIAKNDTEPCTLSPKVHGRVSLSAILKGVRTNQGPQPPANAGHEPQAWPTPGPSHCRPHDQAHIGHTESRPIAHRSPAECLRMPVRRLLVASLPVGRLLVASLPVLADGRDSGIRFCAVNGGFG